MIYKSIKKNELYLNLDRLGLKKRIVERKTVLIKINLARPAEPGHPRTDIHNHRLSSDFRENITIQ